MRIVNVKQGTPEWLDQRLGRVTMSELDALVSPFGKIRTGDGPRTYLAKKLCESWLGYSVDNFSAFATEQGIFGEPQARSWYEARFDCDIKPVGFIVADDNRSGCSPDGIILDAGETIETARRGIEIKAPQPVAAVTYALNGELPDKYRMQVQGSMFVTGFQKWEFFSFHKALPSFAISVMRDERLMKTIQQALAEFYERFDAAFEQLNKLADEPCSNPFLK